jgi:hypothetical protein
MAFLFTNDDGSFGRIISTTSSSSLSLCNPSFISGLMLSVAKKEEVERMEAASVESTGLVSMKLLRAEKCCGEFMVSKELFFKVLLMLGLLVLTAGIFSSLLLLWLLLALLCGREQKT